MRIIFPKLKLAHQLLVLLFVGWGVLFCYHEWFVPGYVASKCHWPVVADPASNVTKVLFIADPQLIDNHTYPGRLDWLLLLLKHTVDVHLNRNYHAMMAHLQPDTVFFLGDYLDNGRECSDEYYQGEVKRFRNIFYPKRTQRRYKQGRNWFLNVPGNHDVGFGDGVHPHSVARFTEVFGNPNTVIEENGVDFVIIDAPLYSASDAAINLDARAFVDSLPPKTRPRVLLTHEPLYRDPSTSCGPLRENPKFYVDQRGVQYRNTVEPQLSQNILAKIDPDLVFLGDDHDYCDIVHPEGPREITVKSISMAMGVSHPAVQVMLFTTTNGSLDYDTHLCYVQTPYTNVISYATMACLTAGVIFWWNIKLRSLRYNYLILPTIELGPTSNSRKISNFINEEDSNTAGMYIPRYTNSTSSSWLNYKRWAAYRGFVNNKRRVLKFMRKWNLYAFLRHVSVLAVAVITLYCIVFGSI